VKLLALSPLEKEPLSEETLQRMLFGPLTTDTAARLPKETRQAAGAYAAARSELALLSGWAPRGGATAALADDKGRR
jgi:hypothetical protein